MPAEETIDSTTTEEAFDVAGDDDIVNDADDVQDGEGVTSDDDSDAGNDDTPAVGDPPKGSPDDWMEKARAMGWAPAEPDQKPNAGQPTQPHNAPQEDEFDVQSALAIRRMEALDKGEDETWVATMVANDRIQFENAKLMDRIAIQTFEQTIPAYKQQWLDNGLPEDAFETYTQSLRNLGPRAFSTTEGQQVAIRLAMGDYYLRQLASQKAGAKKTADDQPTAGKPGPSAKVANGGTTASNPYQSLSPEDRRFVKTMANEKWGGKVTAKQIEQLRKEGLIS